MAHLVVKQQTEIVVVAAAAVAIHVVLCSVVNVPLWVKAKAKAQVLSIAPLNWTQQCQRRFTIVEGWLIGTGCSTVAQASSAQYPRNGLWTCSYAAGRHTTPQSTMLGLHPIIHVPNYMDYYSFTDPWGMDGWVGWSIVDVWPTKWSSVQLAVWRRIGKVCRPRPAFYPLCYATNLYYH